MLLADEPNIRETIAFPLNQNAQDLLMGAPTEVTDERLAELHLARLSIWKPGSRGKVPAKSRTISDPLTEDARSDAARP